MITHEYLEELIYDKLIKKEKMLDKDLLNYDEFCFYCNKHLNDNEKYYHYTAVGKVVVCKDCLSKLEHLRF